MTAILDFDVQCREKQRCLKSRNLKQWKKTRSKLADVLEGLQLSLASKSDMVGRKVVHGRGFPGFIKTVVPMRLHFEEVVNALRIHCVRLIISTDFVNKNFVNMRRIHYEPTFTLTDFDQLKE